MKELSLNILDVAKNSVTAGATKIGILVEETPGRLTITITDNGCGMTPEFVRQVTDPFTTTRTTRKVGMGLSLMKREAQMSGGDLSIEGSPDIDFVFTHRTPAGEYTLDTGEIRQIMGDISLSEPEIIAWLTDYLHENESNIEGKR